MRNLEVIHLYAIFRLGKSVETGSRLVIARGWSEGEMGNDSLMEFPFGVNKNVLELDKGGGCTTL